MPSPNLSGKFNSVLHRLTLKFFSALCSRAPKGGPQATAVESSLPVANDNTESLPFSRANVALSFVTVSGHSLSFPRLHQGRTAIGLQPPYSSHHSCHSRGGTGDLISSASPYCVQNLAQALFGVQLGSFPSTLGLTAGYLILNQVARTSEGEKHHHYHQPVGRLSMAAGL